MRNTVQSTIKSFSALLVFTSLAWGSDVPWKGKPYDHWDEQDLQRVFTDSSWVRTTAITRTRVPLTTKDLPNEPIAGRDRGLPATPGRSAETSVGGELNFHVFWASSRVMRAASARKAVPRGGKKDVDVEKYASEPQEEYQIVVQSEDMVPLFRHDEKFFQANPFLEVRKTKQKFAPSSVRYERDEKGQLVTSAVFFFPKKTASGDPTIRSDEKNVEFNCKIEGTALRVNFEPQKMVDNNGPAF
jgi:hypothetical protein